MKQAIAILDATGENGRQVAKALAADHRLLLFGHDTEKLDQLKKEIKKIHPNADFDCPGCAFEASWEADVIIMDTTDEKATADKIREVATQKLVIELTGGANEFNLQHLLPNSMIRQVDDKDEKRMLDTIRTILNTTQ